MTDEDLEQVAIEAAAEGLISGSLAEWPLLGRAFKSRGYAPGPLLTKEGMRALSQQILLDEEKRKKASEMEEGVWFDQDQLLNPISLNALKNGDPHAIALEQERWLRAQKRYGEGIRFMRKSPYVTLKEGLDGEQH